jgi:tRNA (cmo5U34)-methyltransferase
MKKQKFSFDTIQDFDKHILQSIPNYNVLINMIQSMSGYFVVEDATIYDLGCSTGQLLKSLPYENAKVGVDLSEHLLPITDPIYEDITFQIEDLNNDYWDVDDACLVYSIFTMQFLKKSRRDNYLQTIYEGLVDGGALFLCEKIYQDNGAFQEVFSFSHYDYKKQSFKESEIYSKEKDLRSIMKPNTNNEILEMLQKAGFSKITAFWQSFNFIGYLAIK